ncbi:Crp/Fnr family transcriptional regulator [Pararhodonellum marinum]|uniref:Crp/Fnr family transcriptional regulator n=1 Tax=Pararhodonellum marinum TaxID=2755358 RepID=UPI001E57139E|nr:Crp/Fnr family transcriptional regulator [Pararhodonellum marinum]
MAQKENLYFSPLKTLSKKAMSTKMEESIQSIFQLPQVVLAEVCDAFKPLDLPKIFFLLRSGKICHNIWFVQSGLTRHFYVDDRGKERNTWFTVENNFTTDIPSLLNQQPARENIQLLEDSIIYAIAYSDVQKLQQKHHAFCIWYIKMLENNYFHQIEQRIDELQFMNATERYFNLLKKEPSFSQRISLGNIASYLNISQETLSRIRNEKPTF